MIREKLIGRQFTYENFSGEIKTYTIARGDDNNYSILLENGESVRYSARDIHERIEERGSWKLIPVPVIDYTIPGTPIPTLPEGTEYRVVLWEFDTGRFRSFSGPQTNFVSYGSYSFNNIDCVLCEVAGHVNVSTKFIIKLADIQALTPIQPIIEAEYVLKTDDKKQLTHNDLKEGDYVYEEMPYGGGNFISIVDITSRGPNAAYFIGITAKNPKLLKNSIFANQTRNVFRYATQEEIDWLNACIAANEFVSKEVALAGLSKKPNEKDLFSELEVINPAKGFSMSQFAKALESIPWMEKDDAKDIYKEVEKHFKSIKIEEEVIT